MPTGKAAKTFVRRLPGGRRLSHFPLIETGAFPSTVFGIRTGIYTTSFRRGWG